MLSQVAVETGTASAEMRHVECAALILLSATGNKRGPQESDPQLHLTFATLLWPDTGSLGYPTLGLGPVSRRRSNYTARVLWVQLYTITANFVFSDVNLITNRDISSALFNHITLYITNS